MIIKRACQYGWNSGEDTLVGFDRIKGCGAARIAKKLSSRPIAHPSVSLALQVSIINCARKMLISP